MQETSVQQSQMNRTNIKQKPTEMVYKHLSVIILLLFSSAPTSLGRRSVSGKPDLRKYIRRVPMHGSITGYKKFPSLPIQYPVSETSTPTTFLRPPNRPTKHVDKSSTAPAYDTSLMAKTVVYSTQLNIHDSMSFSTNSVTLPTKESPKFENKIPHSTQRPVYKTTSVLTQIARPPTWENPKLEKNLSIYNTTTTQPVVKPFTLGQNRSSSSMPMFSNPVTAAISQQTIQQNASEIVYKQTTVSVLNSLITEEHPMGTHLNTNNQSVSSYVADVICNTTSPSSNTEEYFASNDTRIANITVTPSDRSTGRDNESYYRNATLHHSNRGNDITNVNSACRHFLFITFVIFMFML